MNNSTPRLSPERDINNLKKRLKQSQKHLFRKAFAHSSLWLGNFLYRLLELLLCIILIVLFALPLTGILFLRKLATGKTITIRNSRNIVGTNGQELSISTFNIKWPTAANLALLFYVVSGKLGLVGASMEDFSSHQFVLESSYLHTEKPGIISLWNVRKNSNIGHEGNVAAEWEYRFTHSPVSNLFLILRAIPSYFFQTTEKSTEEQIHLFDICFANMTMRSAVGLIRQIIAKGGRTKSLFFINPDCLNKTFQDGNYREILQNADHVFPDGIGLTIACKILQNPLKENVNGTDMLPFLCEMAAENNHSLFLLGGQPGIAEQMATNLEKKYGVEIAGTQHGFFDHELENNAVIHTINGSGADIILVAFGAPLQEKWIASNTHKLETAVAMGVGGLFDFYSENTKRAPRWLREMGLEWCYRMLQEPGRMWKRYIIGNPLFLLRVLLWKIRRTGKA